MATSLRFYVNNDNGSLPLRSNNIIIVINKTIHSAWILWYNALYKTRQAGNKYVTSVLRQAVCFYAYALITLSDEQFLTFSKE